MGKALAIASDHLCSGRPVLARAQRNRLRRRPRKAAPNAFEVRFNSNSGVTPYALWSGFENVDRYLCPEGTIGLSLGFQPQDTFTIGPRPEGAAENLLRIPLGIQGGNAFYRHLQGGRPFYPYPGLKPRAESCSPFGTKSVFSRQKSI
jgi:hypothetical protein